MNLKVQSQQKWQYRVIDGIDVINTEVVVHRFAIEGHGLPGRVFTDKLREWEKSEEGQWVLTHCIGKYRYEQFADPMEHKHKFMVVARLNEIDITYFNLRFVQ